MDTRWGMATDTGHRSVNEDAALAHPPVFAVADGMGGHARGDMASRSAVDALRELAEHAGAPLTAADVGAALTRAAEQIQATMAAEAGPDAIAGTTVAGAVRTEHAGEPAWLVLNVGDSRVYRLRGTTFEQVSVDHSLVQEMVDAGTLDPAAARTHPRRNIITRAVGTDLEVEADFFMLPAHPGDRLLMCTDGLVGELEDQEIAAVLTATADPAEAAAALVAQAVVAGAEDNVTVVVVDTGDDADDHPATPGS
ncbi:PP2C family protein-serine/threonine phosphatase [Georgenia yuyongxinii]|uniref:Serine/threonine-protein phosphatase n=1 Tax=Georgenia yuyongxinii TaxID=2589797 RepID=A0A552WRI6_9MICO|nr:protein phosphatase 2C domain-containing protein [Georgenia yuyongxinii]TRW45421.1 serine/threonine-protein phosphatase [Georgenia yuyongxinii]